MYYLLLIFKVKNYIKFELYLENDLDNRSFYCYHHKFIKKGQQK